MVTQSVSTRMQEQSRRRGLHMPNATAGSTPPCGKQVDRPVDSGPGSLYRTGVRYPRSGDFGCKRVPFGASSPIRCKARRAAAAARLGAGAPQLAPARRPGRIRARWGCVGSMTAPGPRNPSDPPSEPRSHRRTDGIPRRACRPGGQSGPGGRGRRWPGAGERPGPGRGGDVRGGGRHRRPRPRPHRRRRPGHTAPRSVHSLLDVRDPEALEAASPPATGASAASTCW